MGGAIKFKFKTMHAQRQERMRKGITAHARLKKEAYQPRNTKIHSSRRIAFFAEKRHRANVEKKGIALM